jgi:GTP cyclohydrolase II
VAGQVFADEIAGGVDVRPSIAVTKARLNLPEVTGAMGAGRLKADGTVLHASGDISVTKIAIDPVWHLPGVAARFGVSEGELRRTLFEQTGGMFPELVTRPDMSVFLPPIGNITAYIMGEIGALTDPKRRLACRVHDECNGSDVFGSDICTCRPYLIHGIEECVREAQGAARGSSSTTGRRAGRWARSPSSWSTTPASARRVAIPRPPTSSARNAWPASRTPASSSSCPTCSTGSASPASTG